MRDLPQGHSVQIVKKSTNRSMFDIYARPINIEDEPYKSVMKLEWNVVEYGGAGQPANASAKANMNIDTAAKIAKDILDGHPFAAKRLTLQQLEADLEKILANLSIKSEEDKKLLADPRVKRLMIERSMASAIEKAYLQPNRIRETWDFMQDKNGNPYYRYIISSGGKGKNMLLESRHISIEAREYNGSLQYHVAIAVTQGQRSKNGAILPVQGAPVTKARTIVSAKEMVEAMEKLLLFIQGSVTYDIAAGIYRPFTINASDRSHRINKNVS